MRLEVAEKDWADCVEVARAAREKLSTDHDVLGTVGLYLLNFAKFAKDDGQTELENNLSETAEILLLRALELEPENPATIYNYACSLARRGKREPALEHLRKAIEIEKGENLFSITPKDPDFTSLYDDQEFQEIVRQ